MSKHWVNRLDGSLWTSEAKSDKMEQRGPFESLEDAVKELYKWRQEIDAKPVIKKEVVVPFKKKKE